jgi:uncharacterized membrane protein (DUF4010 family)
VIGASTILFLRVLVAIAVLNRGLAQTAAPYFALPLMAGVAATVLGWYWNNDAGEEPREVTNPLQFWNSVQMAIVFQTVLYLVHWLDETFGNRGLLVSGAILGITDVDALTISMAQGVETDDWTVASQALTIGILSNTFLKAVVAAVLGRGRFRWLAVSGLATILAALVISLVVL